jgi:quercetin dioxygenase-like cupin family protein
MKADADVPRILKMDGIGSFCLDKANEEVVSIPDIIERYGRDISWSHTLINSQSNSATLICQLPGEGNRMHHHPDWDEWWYIVEGRWEWNIEGAKKTICEGEIVFINRNRKHQITALGEKVAIRLAVSRYDVDHVYEEDDY